MTPEKTSGRPPEQGDLPNIITLQMAGYRKLLQERAALREALIDGMALIRGEAVGAEWKQGCSDFLAKGRAALK